MAQILQGAEQSSHILKNNAQYERRVNKVLLKAPKQIINSKVPFVEETKCRGDGEALLPGMEAFL